MSTRPGAPAPESEDLTTAGSEETLRRCLRDLLTLQGLPAVWNGRPHERIKSLAAEAFAALMDLELVVVRTSSGANAADALFVQGPSPGAEARAALLAGLVPHLQHFAGAVEDVHLEPLGPMRLVVLPLGFHGGGGRLAAGSRRPDFPADRDKVLLRTAAGLLATSLEGAKLLAEARAAQTRATLLSEASAVLSSAGDTHEHLRRIVPLAEVAFAERCVAALRDERDGFRVVDSSGRREPSGLAAEPLGARLFEAATTGTTVLARDHAPGAPAAAHTLLAVPIAHGGALLGALALQARDSGIGFSRADVETAEELGRRVAMVAENGRLFREAQAADRRKDEFLAMLGHELRNPLAPIRTALELMNLKGQDTFRHERTIIDRHVRHMVGLVDDLLDVSRITRGTLTLRREPVELSAVLRRSLEMTSPVLERRAHRVVLELPDQPLLLHADEARLVQMISNLLHNAAKYSPPGGEVRITARREGAQVVVAVRDAGIGIAPEMLDRVFELFVQEKRSLDRAEGGLGIGLSIVRSLAEVHGGSVSAHSDGLGCGSEFTLTLPLLLGDAEPAAAPAPLPPPELPAAASADTRLLVVDDNVDAAEVLAEALATLGYGVRVAHDGPQALDAAREFAPRVALVDIGLPVMDGYQVAQRLRATFGKGVRLVALTGYGQDEDRRRSREAGFEQHLVKPIDFNALARLLEELARAA